MKHLIFIIAIFYAGLVNGQSNNELNELSKFNITPEVLTMGYNEDWENISYNHLSTATTEGDSYVGIQEASYDPSKPAGQKWTLISVNEKTPTKDIHDIFNKEKNSINNKEHLGVDLNSLKKVSEDDDYLIYSFKFSHEAMPRNYAYFKDCTTKLFINKKTNRLEKLQITNDEPTKLGMLKLSEVNNIVYYKFDDNFNQYVVEKNDSYTVGKFLGTTAKGRTIIEYRQMAKVK